MTVSSRSRRTRQRVAKHRNFERRSRLETLERRELLTAVVWSSGPDLPEPRTDSVALVAPNNSVYLVGGNAANATATPTLSASADAWALGQKTDTQRNDLGAVRSGGNIHLFGGTGGTEGSDEVLSYDYRFGDSQDIAKMNQVRYDFGFASDASGRAYAIGGIGVRDDGEIWSQAERFDPATGSWNSIASLPAALHGTSAIGDGNGHIFVFGGSTSLNDAGIQSTAYRYDIASDSWSTVAAMQTGTRDSAAAIDEGGLIYLTGGMTQTGATDAVQVYDATTNTWSSQTALPAPVYSHAATYDPQGRIIVAGGFDSGGTALATVYRSQRLNVAQTAPVFTSSPVSAGSLDQPYSYSVQATGNPVASYSLVAAPAGMSIDSSTGLISWQPIDGQLGIHAVTVRATNTVGQTDQSFDVTVVADTIAPTTPANLVAGNITETTVTLNWDPSTDAVGVDRYEVSTARYTGPRFGKRWVYTLVDTVTTTTSTITGLTPLTGKAFSVQAIDAAGNRSARTTRLSVTTLAQPTLTFRVGTQTSGIVQSPAKNPLQINLFSRANPTATFSIVNGPATMTIDSATGVVQWTPQVADIGTQTITFRAENSVGSVDLDVVVDIVSDAPQLSVAYNPTTGGQRYAVAGSLFQAQVNDASQSLSTYELVSGPAGMTIDSVTGLVSWTPIGSQGGTHSVTVRGTNAGGTTDLIFSVLTHFTAPVTGVTVTGTTLLEPTVSWTAPTGEGASLVDHYTVNAYVRYRNGRAWRVHSLNFAAAAGSESVVLAGLRTGKNYTLTIIPVDAAGNEGLANRDATVTSIPALPQVGWTVNGYSGGSSVPGAVIAGQPAEIILADRRPDPSTIILVSGPTGLSYDPVTKTGNWTPGATDVTTGFLTSDVTFQATNDVGSVNVVVPIRVFFSGAVQNASATKSGTAVTVNWDPPTDNATPVAGYQITAHWTWSGRKRSSTRTVGNVTSASYSQYPTGAVYHRGVTITPIDADGNLGVTSSLIPYGAPPVPPPPANTAPVATADAYSVNQDTVLTVAAASGVLVNDTDAQGDALTARIVTPPTNGTVTLANDGSFSYTPNAGFNGSDQFTYVANDSKLDSSTASVAITVDAVLPPPPPVNAAPVANADAYSVNQDTALTVAAASGVLVNDTDAQGDALTARIVTPPTNGTVTLANDGSFVYTPNAGFNGSDQFTYVANDSKLDSSTASVAITVNSVAPPVAGTKFFVVDYSSRSTYEYDAAGSLVEDYGLVKANKKPLGVATNADGSLVLSIDKSKKVFVYDNAGNLLRQWKAEGLSKPEGIATDGTDVWIVDRKLDKVFFFAGGATVSGGSLTATSSFPLDRGNRTPRGITTDGTSLWVVNDYSRVDSVFKYSIAGNLLGSWQIDTANAKPTGITIDPNDVRNVWIVDTGTDQIYRYDNAASTTSGALTASANTALDAGNRNPQGIADPVSTVQEATTDSWLQTLPSPDPSRAYWQNSVDPMDTNDDGRISALDALLVINYLSRHGDGSIDGLSDEDPMVDVNDDGRASSLDALQVVNAIAARDRDLQGTARGEGEHLLDVAITELTRDPDWIGSEL